METDGRKMKEEDRVPRKEARERKAKKKERKEERKGGIPGRKE